MTTLSYSLTDNTLTFFDRSLRSRTVQSDHPGYAKARELLVSGTGSLSDLETLLDSKTAIEVFGEGRIEIAGNTVYLDGTAIRTALTKRMLEIASVGGNIAPLSNFLIRVQNNPSAQAAEELYLWIEGSKLPINADGRFVAYKRVDSDYASFHSAPDGTKVMNLIGTVVEMPRNKVDDRRDRTCSYGLHFCSWDYLPSYWGNSGRIVVVLVDPADVVSIPNDYGNAKGRACSYEVVGEVTEGDYETRFEGTPVTSFGDAEDHDEAPEAELEAVAPDRLILADVSFQNDAHTLLELFEEIRLEGGIRPAGRALNLAESTIRTWLAPYKDALHAHLTAFEADVDEMDNVDPDGIRWSLREIFQAIEAHDGDLADAARTKLVVPLEWLEEVMAPYLTRYEVYVHTDGESEE